ncbi:hypothetical protein D3C86_1993440 [compost metagenome]
MVTVRAQADRFACRQLHRLHLLHTHHIVFHARLMNLYDLGRWRGRADQLAVASGGERHERPGRLLTGYRCPNPGLADIDLGLRRGLSC